MMTIFKNHFIMDTKKHLMIAKSISFINQYMIPNYKGKLTNGTRLRTMCTDFENKD